MIDGIFFRFLPSSAWWVVSQRRTELESEVVGNARLDHVSAVDLMDWVMILISRNERGCKPAFAFALEIGVAECVDG